MLQQIRIMNRQHKIPSSMRDSQDFDLHAMFPVTQQHELSAFSDHTIEDHNIRQDSISIDVKDEIKYLQVDNSLLNDDFLEVFKQQKFQRLPETQIIQAKTSDLKQIVLDKSRIELNILPEINYIQHLKIANNSSETIKLSFTECKFKISRALDSSDNSFNPEYLITIPAWSDQQFIINIPYKSEQFGDLFQTLTIRASSYNNSSELAQCIYLPIRVHYFTPKLQISFTGFSKQFDAKLLTKVNLQQIKIPVNRLGEYIFELACYLQDMSYNQKIENTNSQLFLLPIQIKLQTKGRIDAYPKIISIKYKQRQRIRIRTQPGYKFNEKCAIIVRIVNTRLVYVFGLELEPK